MSRVYIIQFHTVLGCYKHRKVRPAICDCNIGSSIFIKQQSRYCIKFSKKINHQSRLKHMNINIQKIINMSWVEYFQEMFHFIIINWFDRSIICIWNRFRVRLIWKIWRVKFNISIINIHRTGFEMKGPGFEVRCWMLAVPLYWYISWFVTMKGFEVIHLYYNN